MMLYKITKIIVSSPDGDTEYFGIVAGVLQGDALTSYLSIICLHNVLKTSIDLMKENGFKREKAKSRRYPAEIITDADYVDERAIFWHISQASRAIIYVWSIT